MLHLLRNVVLAAANEQKYAVPLDATIFSRAPFTLLGGRTRMESIFGRARLTAIVEELNALISAA